MSNRVRVNPRQLQVIQLVRQGLTDRQIAAEVGLSPRTVSNMLSDLYSLTGVSSRAYLVSLLERGLLEHPGLE